MAAPITYATKTGVEFTSASFNPYGGENANWTSNFYGGLYPDADAYKARMLGHVALLQGASLLPADLTCPQKNDLLIDVSSLHGGPTVPAGQYGGNLVRYLLSSPNISANAMCPTISEWQFQITQTPSAGFGERTLTSGLGYCLDGGTDIVYGIRADVIFTDGVPTSQNIRIIGSPFAIPTGRFCRGIGWADQILQGSIVMRTDLAARHSGQFISGFIFPEILPFFWPECTITPPPAEPPSVPFSLQPDPDPDAPTYPGNYLKDRERKYMANYSSTLKPFKITQEK